MDTIGISRPVTREGTNGPAGPKTWERARSQEKEGRIPIFILLIESQSIVSIYLLGWREWRSRLLLVPVFISKALGIVKCDSRSK